MSKIKNCVLFQLEMKNMRINALNEKSSTASNNRPSGTLRQERTGQMIVIMGITLALSVLIMGALAAEISDLDVAVPQERSGDILSEFVHLKEAFGLALNYNLADVSLQGSDPYYFTFEKEMYDESHSYPSVSDIVVQTSDAFRSLELQYNKIFSASLSSLTYSHQSTEGYVYYVCVELSLKDGVSFIKEPMVYSIVCKEPGL